MSDSASARSSCADVASRYRARILSEARPTDAGITYRQGDEFHLLEWSRVERALAAEVGEPQGVRTIVFDLLVEMDDCGCVAYRFDADPTGNAQEVARAIATCLPGERTDASIKSVAIDGVPSRSYPDLESLAEANLETISESICPS
jgi:hypothetical protein